MDNKKTEALSGANNKKINNTEPTRSEKGAAWTNMSSDLIHDSEWEEECILDAKDWVDNGSKL